MDPTASANVAANAGVGLARQRSSAATLKTANAYHASSGVFARKNWGSGCAYSQSRPHQIAKHSTTTNTEERRDGAELTLIRHQRRSVFIHEDRCMD
jgi:hypothetical protein